MDSSSISSDHVAVFMGDDQPHIKPPCSSVQRLRRFTFSKPKSRFVEFSTPIFTQTITRCESEDLLSSRTNKLDSSDSSDESEDEEEEYNKYDEEGFRKGKKKRKINALNKINPRFLVEWLVFIALSAGLVCSLTIPTLKIRLICGLELWRWALMSLSVLSGRLVSGWVIRVVVFLVEKNCTLRGKVLYFVYGLRRRIRNSVWLGFVLLTWTLAFNAKLRQRSKVVEKAFQALIAALIGFTIWLLKIVAVKVLASSFHVTTYFDRMKESVFHHYVLETLSGPPMGDVAYEEAHRKTWRRKVDIQRMKELSMQSKASAWTIKRLASYVRSFGLTTATKAVDESEITSEWEARECSKRIFRNVAKAGVNYIDEEDLMRFLKRVEIHTIFPLFEGALETGKITKSAFRNWVVRAYYERKSLAHSLNDTKRAVQQLHKLASAVVSVIIVVETLTVMNVASTKVIAFMLTQLLLLGFTFQNMCKTVFESVVFVFVMHPFDIGDRCVIDGVQMIVEEMNILTTVFLRQDNEKVYYPNSALITKPISNFYRSPEMCDAVDFTIDASTSKETLIALKKGIQTYIESKPKYWYPKHMVIAKEIDNVSKLKMALCVQHTINHQNYGDRCTRISDLILELRTVFENLGIKYHLLPQEVHLTQVNWRGQLPA